MRLLIFGFCLLLAGCGDPALRTQYMITPLHTATSKPSPTRLSANTIIAIRNMRLPDYLNAQYVPRLDSDGNMRIFPKELWAQEVADNISNLVQMRLSALLGSTNVYSYPLVNNLRPDRFIDVQILEMIASEQQKVFLFTAKWQISDGKEKRYPSYEIKKRYPLKEASPTASELMHYYAQAVEDLTQEIQGSLNH